jgi:diguanylate cyclase (GGDEF)-like protein/PAS domain S-box-containing protein
MAQRSSHSTSSFVPQDQMLLANALESAANAIFITDSIGRIVWANQAFSHLSGYSIEEAVGSKPSLLKSGQQSDLLYHDLWRSILNGAAWRGVLVDKRKDGSFYTVDQTITPLLDDSGTITHFIAVQNDITVQRQQDDHAHYLAYHDALTGLPNRVYFAAFQRQALSQAKTTRRSVAILFVDLDKFKPVNDRLGHDVGDHLLRAVSERLVSSVRKSDGVARIGGDEFVILLPDLEETDIAVALASKLISNIAQPFIIGKQKIQIGASIGIAIYPDDGDDPDELLRKADQAMYLAKNHGGNSYRLFPASF